MKGLKRKTLDVLSFVCVVLPCSFKIPIYRHVFGYRIGKNVKIGFTWIKVGNLDIGDNVRIGHLNRFKNVLEVKICDNASIGSCNTFTSTSEFTSAAGLKARNNRPKMFLGEHCQITMYHYFDIQDYFSIGAYTVIAGRGSVFFTHFLDVMNSAQACKPITIGRYCMVASNVRFAPGVIIGDFCVVGIGSVVIEEFAGTHCLIGGNPALVIKKLPEDAAYFSRATGWIGTFAEPPLGLVNR